MEAAHADVELGLVVIDDTLDHDLAAGHVQPSALVHDIDGKKRTLFLGFRNRGKRAGQGQKHPHFHRLLGLRDSGYAGRGKKGRD